MNKVLFLCTGNSCRSQMAEGFARAKLDEEKFEILSAGIEAHGLNSRAVATMAEVGIDISKQTSKTLTPEMLQDLSMIITVCGDANERCPVVPGRVIKHHWPLPDPAKFEGNESEIAREFARVRDEIKQRVATLSAELSGP